MRNPGVSTHALASPRGRGKGIEELSKVVEALRVWAGYPLTPLPGRDNILLL